MQDTSRAARRNGRGVKQDFLADVTFGTDDFPRIIYGLVP
jgi:hypothetical protein